ncbi:unnamed protein product [Ectocarpus sp. 6 AP-2014]
MYVLIEALADGGVRMGLPRAMAIKLAAQTVKGAAEMVLETREHPSGPKNGFGLSGLACRVGPGGGLPISAIESLENNGFPSAAIQAVIAVPSKSIEMRNAGE